MVYDDDTGTPIFRPIPIGRRRADSDVELTDAMWDAIMRIITANPRWGPKQVHAELRRTRHDIPMNAILVVLDGRR
jgi:hypothetical protein